MALSFSLTGEAHLSESRKIKIREAYRDYTPKVDAAAIVDQLLGTVPDKYLRGLDCVVLTNVASLSRKDRVGRVWSRNRKFDKSRILGRYYLRASNRLPYIELRVDKIINSLKGMQLRIPFLRKLVFGSVLFHELGHHIHHTIRPEHKEKEDVADSWARRLQGNFVRTQYWYMLPMLIPAAMIFRFIRSRRWI